MEEAFKEKPKEKDEKIGQKEKENVETPVKLVEKGVRCNLEERFKVNIPIREMFNQIPCCIQFLHEIIKHEEKTSDTKFTTLTKNFHAIYELQVTKKEGDP